MTYLASFDPELENNVTSWANREPAPESESNFTKTFKGVADPIAFGNTIDRSLVYEPLIVGSLAASNAPRLVDELAGTSLTDLWHENITQPLVNAREKRLIDPKTHGVAAQILDTVGGLIGQAYTTGAVGTGIISGINETVGEVSKGVDLKTAGQEGTITGLVNSIGIAAPASMATKALPIPQLLQHVMSGIGVNTALGAAADEARIKVLREGGYNERANAIKENESTNALVNIALGAAFGGLAHFTGSGATNINSQQLLGILAKNDNLVDAALVLNQSAHLENQVPGLATNSNATEQFARQFQTNMQALLEGDPIVPVKLNGFIDDPVPQSAIDIPEIKDTSVDTFSKNFPDAGLQSVKTFVPDDAFIQRFIDETGGNRRNLDKVLEKVSTGAKLGEKQKVYAEWLSTNIKAEQSVIDAKHAEIMAARAEDRGDFIYNDVIETFKAKGDYVPTRDDGLARSIQQSIVGEARRIELTPRQAYEQFGKSWVDNAVAKVADITEKPLEFHPEFTAAQDSLKAIGDNELTYIDQSGDVVTKPASVIEAEVIQDAKDLQNIGQALKDAVTCFLQFGDTY